MENIDKIKCVLIDFENNDKTLDEAAKEILLLFSVSNSEVFEHYGKPFTSGRELWDFLTANYNFTPKT